MLLKYYISSLSLFALCCNAAAVPSSRPYRCEEITFTYDIESTVKAVPQPPDISTNEKILSYLSSLSQNLKTAANVTRRGNYTLAGLYCPAASSKSKPGVPLQVLIHGSSYTKEYWNRGAWGNMTLQNSYQQYAHGKGVSTLAVDRLCYGGSSKVDPLLDCQLSTNIEVFHALFVALKQGTASPKIPIPAELALVGHSAGATMGSIFLQTYPNDVDTAILEGWPSASLTLPGAAEYYAARNQTPPAIAPRQNYYAPGALAFPDRFQGLPQGYIVSTNATARNPFYAGDYDPSYPLLDYNTQSTFPLGEATYSGVTSFAAFKGRVIVANGELDFYPHYDPDVVERTRGRFPAAKSYDWVEGDEAGHCFNYHRSARGTYQKIFAVLERRERRRPVRQWFGGDGR
ncbi:MAG: hypothetical protein Q9169_006258 [Polycauliona sp. 2 TL-2023]